MTTDHTFYQHGDEPDAANFAQAFGIAVRTSYLLSGFEFTVDLGELELDVNAGIAAVWRGDFETSSTNIDPIETRAGAAHPIEKEAVDAIALEEDAVNHVFLDADVDTSSNPTLVVNTTGDEPSDESVKLGEVDTHESNSTDAISDQWRLVLEDATLSFPDYDAAEKVAADLHDGTNIHLRDPRESYRIEGSTLERIHTEIEQLVEHPDRKQAVELDNGDSHEIPVIVPDGARLEVYRWGAYNGDELTAPTGLDVELLDEDDTVQETANTVDDKDIDTPVASHENTTGSDQVFVLRCKNDTGDVIGDGDDDRGVGMHFGYRVV